MFRPNAFVDTLPPSTEDGKENFNLEEFIGSLPAKSAPFEKRFVSDAILEGLISGDCIMSTTRSMYPPLTLTEPSFIPYPPLPYSDFSHIPCCIPCCNPVDNWHSMHGLYPTTWNTCLPLLHQKEAAAPFIRAKRPLESKITWSAAYNMDYNYKPPAMTMAGSRPYSQPRTFGYARSATFNAVPPDIVPRVIPDCDISPPRINPPKTRATEYLIQKPRPALGTNPLVATQPVLPTPTFSTTQEIKKKPVTYRFVYPKNKKYIRVKKSKKHHKCRKAPTRAQKLVLSLTRPLLDCYRKGLDDISRKISSETDLKSSCSGPNSPKTTTHAGYDLLAVAMLTKCLHFEQSNVNPLHPLKRYVVQDNAPAKAIS